MLPIAIWILVQSLAYACAYLGSATTLHGISADCSCSADETAFTTASRSWPPAKATTAQLVVASSIFIFLRSLCMRKCFSNCGMLSIPRSSKTSGSLSPSFEQFLVAIASHITRPLGLRNAAANPGICVQGFCAMSSRFKSFVHSPCKNLKVSGPLELHSQGNVC